MVEVRELKKASALAVCFALGAAIGLRYFFESIGDPILSKSSTVFPLVFLLILSLVMFLITRFRKLNTGVFASFIIFFPSMLVSLISCLPYSSVGVADLLVPIVVSAFLIYDWSKEAFANYMQDMKEEWSGGYNGVSRFFAVFAGLYYMKEHAWVTYTLIVLSAFIFLYHWMWGEKKKATQPIENAGSDVAIDHHPI